MFQSINRRGFLASGLAGAALAPLAARAVEPIARTSGHHFKLSLAAYSYRDLLKAKPPKLTLIDFIDDCAKLNLDGTELTAYYFPDPLSADYLRQIKSEAFRRGLDISGTAVGNDFNLPRGEKRDGQIAYVREWIEYADLMGAPVVRIFAGEPKPGMDPNEARDLIVEAIETCCDYAAKYGIFLAIENHHGVTLNPTEMLTIIHRVKSPWFGVNVDTGNFHTPDVYGDIAKIAPYAVNVQVKVKIQAEGKDAEPTDYGRLAKIFAEAGYRGYLVLELEEPGDPRELCRKHIEEMRAAFT